MVEWWITQGVDGRVPVIAGIITPSTPIALQATRAAAELGADAALIVTPYYPYPVSQTGLYKHFRHIADHSPLPIVLYNNPRLTHVHLDIATVERLLEYSHIVGIADCSDNLQQLVELLERTYTTFQVLVGSGQILAAAFEAGCDGAIPAIANVLPQSCRHFYDAVLVGKFGEARRWNERWQELERLVTTEYGVPGLKAVLNALGLPAGLPRPPLRPLNLEKEGRVRELVHRCMENTNHTQELPHLKGGDHHG